MSLKAATTCQAFVETGQEAIGRLAAAGCAFTGMTGAGPLAGTDLVAAIGEADAFIADLDTFTAVTFDSVPKLQLVSRWGVGFDAVDLKAATAAGVIVTNTPGVLDETVADLAFALLLGVARGIHLGHATVMEGRWDRAWRADVHHKTLGIVGCGRIGTAVARRAAGFNMRVVAFDLFPSERARELGVEFVPLEELLQQADFVSLHAAVTEQSRGMIGEAQLRAMKPTALLVNTSRGALIDEAALTRALNEGVIAGAALDTFQEEPLPRYSALRSAKNVLLTPHMASLTTDNGRRISDAAVQAVLDLAAGRPPKNIVNPEVLKSPALRTKLKLTT
ncbi:MAG TPA: hydroxyacid dehydrogenase [Verrucomicrobiales bacterium]|nr:hydroxyacid dehydrogenase [Verrucomicrobiales bacterium]